MPVPVLKGLQERLPELGFYNCFGQSEIAPLATVLRPEEHEARPDSCGRSVLFVELRVLDPDTGADVGPDEVGEVVYRSPQLCEGYWENQEATEEAFKDGWFHSGDLVRRDAEGYIFVVDRIKDVINTGGVLVASREVEDALYTHPAVAEVAVIAIPDERWIEAICAVVVAKEDDLRRGPDGARPQVAGRLQGAEADRVRGRAAAQRVREVAQARAARRNRGNRVGLCARPPRGQGRGARSRGTTT